MAGYLQIASPLLLAGEFIFDQFDQLETTPDFVVMEDSILR
jgi:hypothetical protein